MADDLRTRIATTIYGDGEELAWARSIALADLIIWELGLKEIKPEEDDHDHHVDVTWVPPGTIAKWLGENP